MTEVHGGILHSTTCLLPTEHVYIKSQLNLLIYQDYCHHPLSMVLLGIRSALTDNNNCSAAELVHGTTLCLPGEFFTPPKVTTLLTQQAM